MTGDQDSARELLELEQAQQAGPLTAEHMERWFAHAAKLFGRAGGANPRRSARLPADARCTFLAGKGTFACVLSEVSLAGLTATGPVFAYLNRSVPVVLQSVDVGGQSVRVELPCRLMGARAVNGQWTAGLAFSGEEPREVWERYFRGVYYPLYLDHLRSLAGARAAASPEVAPRPTDAADGASPPAKAAVAPGRKSSRQPGKSKRQRG